MSSSSDPTSAAQPTSAVRRWPSLCISASVSGAPRNIPAIRGRVPRPAAIGLQPQAYWKSWVLAKLTPTIATMTAVCSRALPRTAARANSRRSSIGSAVRRSWRTKPTPVSTRQRGHPEGLPGEPAVLDGHGEREQRRTSMRAHREGGAAQVGAARAAVGRAVRRDAAADTPPGQRRGRGTGDAAAPATATCSTARPPRAGPTATPIIATLTMRPIARPPQRRSPRRAGRPATWCRAPSARRTRRRGRGWR